jgi:hypothetical protein
MLTSKYGAYTRLPFLNAKSDRRDVRNYWTAGQADVLPHKALHESQRNRGIITDMQKCASEPNSRQARNGARKAHCGGTRGQPHACG